MGVLQCHSGIYRSTNTVLAGNYWPSRIKLMKSKDLTQKKQKKEMSILCLVKVIHNNTTQSKIAVQTVNRIA